MTTLTLANLKREKMGAPYTKSIRVNVLAVGEIHYFRDAAGEQKPVLNVGVADSSESARATVYDANKFSRFVEGTTLLLRNVVPKPYGFLVNQQTRICGSGALDDIPEEHEVAARHIIRPPVAPTQSLNEAVRSPPKQRVSVAGKILMEEEKREVMVGQTPANIRNIYIQDSTMKKCKVALWREHADTVFSLGEHICITDVVTNVYRNETSLSTTLYTTIRKTEAPEIEADLVCEGVCLEDDQVTFLLADDADVFICCIDVVAEALAEAMITADSTEAIETYLTSKCSPVFSFKATTKGALVTKLQFFF